MNSTLTQILEATFGTGLNLIPLFIHNSRSQQVEGVIITSAENLLVTIAGIFGHTTPAPTTPAPTTQSS